MKTRTIFCLLFVALFIFTGNVFALAPTAISPDGVAPVVEGNCPPFVWSGVEGAVAYEVAVFRSKMEDVFSYEEMKAMADPLLSKKMPAHTLSWGPPPRDCLDVKARYVWYVHAIDCDGNGTWSEGRGLF